MTRTRVYGIKTGSARDIFPLTPRQWKNVLNAIRGHEHPKTLLLRQLSYALFNESEGNDRDIRIRYMRISQCLHLGTIDDISEAWDELLAWMEELGIDQKEITERAEIKKGSTIEDEEPSSPYRYDESEFMEEPEYTAIPNIDDTEALTRSAARFVDTEPEDADETEWAPIDLLSDLTRELVALGRERVKDLSDVELPERLLAFLGDGVIEYSPDNPPSEFWHNVRALFTAELGTDGELTYLDESPDLADLINEIIEKKERWIPIDETPEVMRDLVMECRSRSIDLFGGNLSWHDREDGHVYDKKRYAHIRFLLEDGLIRHSKQKPAPKFWNDLKNLLFENDPETLVNLAHPVIAMMEEWKPIEEIPEKRRKLVNALRTRATELYVNGHFLSTDPNLLKLLADGSIAYSKKYPARRYWPKIRQTLAWPAKDEPPWVMDLIHPVIAEKERWIPIEQIPSAVRELVSEARTKAIDLYGGNFNVSIKTVDRWKSGSLACSPVRQLVKSGKIQYSTQNLPRVFFRRCRELLFGLERTADGRFRRVKVPDKIAEMLARLERQGEQVWDLHGTSQAVAHPGTAKRTKRMRAIKPSKATAFHITKVYAQQECSLSFGGGFDHGIHGGHVQQLDLPSSILSFPLVAGGFEAVSIKTGFMMGLGITASPLH